MDLSDINLLKRLDEIDSKEYSDNDASPVKKKELAVSNDFDTEDFDDIDDLLYDDDDDVPVNKSSPQKSSLVNSPKSVKAKPLESPLKLSITLGKSFETSEEEETGSESVKISQKKIGQHKKQNPDLHANKSQKSVEEKPSVSPKKLSQRKNALDLFLQDDEENYLGDLGLNKLEDLTPTSGFSHENIESSPQKLKLAAKNSMDVEFEDDNDILDSLESTSKKTSPSKTKRQSFMDDLLGKDTQKSSVKKLSSLFDEKPEKSAPGGDKDDVMVFGGYVPSAASTNRTSGSGRRQSVTFKDDVQVSLSPLSSPAKGKPIPLSETKRDTGIGSGSSRRAYGEPTKSAPPGGRLGRTDSKIDGIFSSPQKVKKDDWLDFLKDDSKNSPSKSIQKNASTTDHTVANKGSARRKSSSAEWLGLGDDSDDISKAPNRYKVESKTENNDFDDMFSKSELQPSRTGGRKNKAQLPWLSDSSGPETQEKVIRKSGDGPSVESKRNEPDIAKPVTELQAASVPDSTPKQVSFHPAQKNHPVEIDQSAASRNSQVPVSSEPTYNQSHSMHYSVASQPVQQQVIMPQIAEINSQLLSNQSMELSRLQSMVTTLQFEKEQLMQSSELLKKKREEDLKQFEENLKFQQKSFEDLLEVRLKGVQETYEADMNRLKEKLASFENEKKQLSEENKLKVDNLEKSHAKEVQKLKELHNEAVAMLKQNHEDAIVRLKRLKDQEIEAITSTQLHTKSLQALSDQLEERASELASLQKKVEEKHQYALQEKEAFFMAKEKELKTLEKHLHWQMEEGEQERSRLQQLVLRLEKRLQQQTKEGEEDHWDTLQLKTKLEVQRKVMEEEKKMLAETVETEREKVRASQNALMSEQKAVLVHLAQERQQLSSEKREFEILARRVRDEEAKLAARKLKEESSFETQKRILEQENEKIYLERQLAKQETLQVQSERQVLEREKRHLAEEKEKLNEMRLELKRRSDEVEALAQRAVSEREEGRSAIAAARKIEAEHNLRISEFTQQMHEIMERQKELMLEKEKFSEEKQVFERAKANILCVNCKLAVGFPVTVLPPDVRSVHPPHSLVRKSLPATDPNLMVWYVTARKEREYLQEEKSYLKSLKELAKE